MYTHIYLDEHSWDSNTEERGLLTLTRSEHEQTEDTETTAKLAFVT